MLKHTPLYMVILWQSFGMVGPHAWKKTVDSSLINHLLFEMTFSDPWPDFNIVLWIFAVYQLTMVFCVVGSLVIVKPRDMLTAKSGSALKTFISYSRYFVTATQQSQWLLQTTSTTSTSFCHLITFSNINQFILHPFPYPPIVIRVVGAGQARGNRDK